MMREYRSFADVEEEYFINHPDEIVDYIRILLEEFAEDENIERLLSSLRRVVVNDSTKEQELCPWCGKEPRSKHLNGDCP